MEPQGRRAFLKKTSVAAIGIGVSTLLREQSLAALSAGTSPTGLPLRHLGKTGRQVTIVGLGGLFTVARHDQHEKAVEIINRAIDLGINYIDTSALYGDGASELNIGTVMRKRRDEVFLATKSHDYTYHGTMALFDQSRRRLQSDVIDLYQHHFLGKLGTLEQLRQKDSARKAFDELREKGRIRYIGVTGHSARVLADALEDYPYDCALITLNAAGAVTEDIEHLDRFFRIARERNVAVIAMKVVERGALVQKGLKIQPLLHYVLSYPVSTAIIGISEVAHLEENVEAAKAFRPLDPAQMEEIRQLARSKAGSPAP